MIWEVYPGSGLFPIPAPDPRSRGQKNTEPRIPGLDPHYCMKYFLNPFVLKKWGLAMLSFC